MADESKNASVDDALNFTIDDPAPLQMEPPKQQPDIPENEAIMKKLPQVPEDQLLNISYRANAFVEKIGAIDPNSPDYANKVNQIYHVGSEAFRSTTDATSRFLEQSIASSKSDASEAVSKTLADLRNTCDELAPDDETFAEKALGFLPFGNSLQKRVKRYFQRYESNQKQLNDIIASLNSNADMIRKDNAALRVEQKNLYEDMQQLSEAYALLTNLDKYLVDEIARHKANGDESGASTLESTALFACRQRRMDVITQAAVTTQAFLNMGVIQQNNQQIIHGVERAKTTTLTALRTAIIVAQGLENQKLVLDQIDAVNDTTNKMIEYTAKMLKENSTRTWQQATSSGVKPETLAKAFDSVFETLDTIDQYKAQANDIMAENISKLDAQVQRAKEEMERRRPELLGETEDDKDLLRIGGGKK